MYKQEILKLINIVNQMYLADIHRTSHTNIKELSTIYTAFFFFQKQVTYLDTNIGKSK